MLGEQALQVNSQRPFMGTDCVDRNTAQNSWRSCKEETSHHLLLSPPVEVLLRQGIVYGLRRVVTYRDQLSRLSFDETSFKPSLGKLREKQEEMNTHIYHLSVGCCTHFHLTEMQRCVCERERFRYIQHAQRFGIAHCAVTIANTHPLCHGKVFTSLFSNDPTH